MRSLILASIIGILLSPAFAQAGDFAHITYTGSADPHSVIRTKIASSYMDPGEANVIWYVDGEYKGKGPATQDLQVELGNLGAPVKVTALITYRGAQYKEELSVTPAVVDVLWEARTTTPPFYRGKAVPSHNSIIRLMAIPRFGDANTDEPAYAQFMWTKDNAAEIGRGVGAGSVQVLGAFPGRSTNINVKATSGERVISRAIRVTSIDPFPLFYENSPIQGPLTQRAFDGLVERPDQRLALVLVPFGVSIADVEKDRMHYTWSIGGRSVYEGDGRDYASLDLTRSKDPSKTGTVEVSAKIQSLANVMQYGERLFKWNYTK